MKNLSKEKLDWLLTAYEMLGNNHGEFSPTQYLINSAMVWDSVGQMMDFVRREQEATNRDYLMKKTWKEFQDKLMCIEIGGTYSLQYHPKKGWVYWDYEPIAEPVHDDENYKGWWYHGEMMIPKELTEKQKKLFKKLELQVGYDWIWQLIHVPF